MRVKDIGEQKLLEKIKSFCPKSLIGDDGAVLSIDPLQKIVVTTDILVDRVHFSDTTTPPSAVGWRSISANLSDLAAMGATPVAITIGLAIPKELPVEWIESLYSGINILLNKYNIPIIGGDVCYSPTKIISITAIGKVYPNHVIKRSIAKPNQVILVTGHHGMSKAGLELLLNSHLKKYLEKEIQLKFINAHQYPEPRLDVLPYLKEIMKTHKVAGMDSSDGLADAIIQICEMSGVGAEIEQSKIPMIDKLSKYISREEALEWVLYGGEDFELVLCLPEEIAFKLLHKLGKDAHIIGRIIKEKSITLLKENSECLFLKTSGGFQHFS
ncbi:MAG: thiamine-phosphate kinase [Candidatus Atelocyanobacterium thalassa isolate SIO64986]|uniref:Thiamine-monophosphate kinase n=1 Tax=Candidatus Atelocyanobacterium thalassa isolate SIO64986 TaxID=1527444 RepID=A0A086CIJ8_9CHRO|nr:MAG: thiamine-phosphate kinase [Candidatus Atelocyanobacterium thalassa isolate SIO64986]